MQSDKYGDIEDMCLSLKIVTPSQGTITTPSVPRNGAGQTLKHFFIGSEGTLGIITQATMRVHSIPPVKDFQAFLYPAFEKGVEAIHELCRGGVMPAMIRLYDADETRLSFSMKPKTNKFQTFLSDMIKKYLENLKGYDLQDICLMIVGLEGEKDTVSFIKKKVRTIAKKHAGFALGSAPGKSWYAKRYDLPFLRDFLLEHGMWVDVAESSMTWTNVLPLWRDVKAAIKDVFDEAGVPGFAGAHISHTYSSGVCVYFHFASVRKNDFEPQQDSDLDDEDQLIGEGTIKMYLAAKKAATQAILKHNGALSHHHGVGFEHIPFMGRYHDAGALRILRALKQLLDPKDICNPGKLLPPEDNEDMDNPAHLFYIRGLISKKNGRL